jgi:ATP-dependent helicase HrpA
VKSLPPPLSSPDQRLRDTPLLARERAALTQRLHRLAGRVRRNQPVDRSLGEWETALDKARTRFEAFHTSAPALDYPEDLPVSRERERIVEALRDHPVVIVCGDTGSGKTTQLPKMVFEAGGGHFGKIGVTQPRRLAATSMARRVAEECRSKLGDTVGVQVRFEDRTSERTRIQFMTDGMLLAQLPQDPDWLAYNTLIIDEAHERSLNIDFILGCLKNLRQRRPDLKIVISSATLDAERFSEFFDKAPVLSVEGRLFPIEDHFVPEADEDSREIQDRILDALQQLDRNHGDLDTLVFLAGEREIRETAKKLEGHYRGRAEILPLFARLSLNDQQRVFASGSRRRIILATNVAETSITLPGIRAVIDSGEVRVHRVHPQSQIQRLVTEQVSRASAKQRRGRCGRTGPGVCVRLYSEETLNDAPAHTDPEIRRSSLAEVILRMATLGLPPLSEFPLIDPPKGAFIAEGYRTLFEIGAMTERRDLTPRGRVLATFALEPRLARMLEEGHHEKVLPAVLVVAVFLSIQDPRERPADKAEAADRAHALWKDPASDFLGIFNLWNAVCQHSQSRTRRRKFCNDHFLNARRVEEWINLVDDLRETCADHDWPVPASIGEMELADPDSLHRALLAGVPRMIGQREENNLFRSPNGQTFHIFPGSALGKKPPKWVMAFTLLETSRLFARECALLKPEWVEAVAPHLCKYHYERPVWNAKRGFAEAEERVAIGQLTLSQGLRVHYGRVDPDAAREIFLRDGLVPADLDFRHPSLKKYTALLASLTDWEKRLRRPGYFTGSDALIEHFRRAVPADIHSTADFAQWAARAPWVPRISDLFPGEVLHEEDYPDTLEIHGVRIRLYYDYTPDAPETVGLTLSVRDTDLPALPDELLEWTIPAWLPEKIEALIRSLDKPLRNACNPSAKTAAEALEWMHEQGFIWTHSLHHALAAFLAAKLGRILAAPDLDPSKLPPHLITHLRVIDANGKEIHRGDRFPGQTALPRRSGPIQGRQSGEWNQSGLTQWPDRALPVSVEQRGQTRYPALTDEQTACGLRLFAHADEALEQHQAGVIRLFRLLHPDPVKYLQKKFPLPTSVQLDLSTMRNGAGNALDDLLTSVLAEALGQPRTAAEFAAAAERARGELFEIAETRGRQLQQLFELRSQVNGLDNSGLPSDFLADLELQQNTLWAPGWIRDPENLRRYPRYLQAILNRAARAKHDPQKDARKRADLDPALTLLAEHLDRLPPARLREAFRKIEELRIALLCPELKPHEKISLKRFETWLGE